MDPRLVEAAATGNVDDLGRLMREDMLLLDTVPLVGAQTPLHIASMRGHVSFVQEMLQMKKQFAYELNQDGFTPLHLASANGHLQVVVELLKVDHNLCTIKGREGRVPLHCAVVKGRIDVIKTLLSASPLSVEIKTARGDTPLHIAVKNNQFDVLKILVQHLKELNKEGLLNEKDNLGNTVLHLAASRKQYEVVNLLLVEDDIVKKVIEVNSLNERGMSAIDVLMVMESGAGDLEIHTILQKAGAKSRTDINHQVNTSNVGESLEVEIIQDNQEVPPSTQQSDDDLPTRIRYWPLFKEMRELFGYKHKKDSIKNVRSILLTVAALMTTATYQAVLSPPGGVWQDDNNGHTAGTSIMGTKSEGAFWLFVFGNSVGYYTSLYMICWLTIDFPLQFPLILLMFSMSFNYSSSMTRLVPNAVSSFITSVAVTSGCFAPFIPNVLRRLMQLGNKIVTKCVDHCR